MQEDQTTNSDSDQPVSQPFQSDVIVPAPTTNSPEPAGVNNSPDQTVNNPSLQPVSKTEQNSGEVKKEGGFLSFALTLIAAFILVQVINLFVFQSYKVFGSSMFPTLHNGDRLIISKLSRTLSKATKKPYEPKRADIIVFVDPLQPDLQLIKRVIGLPGERVVVKSGKITVFNSEHPNGFNPDDAEYGKSLPVTSGNTDITVPQGHIFVSGDNREGSNSLDSRNELGTVPLENIIGKLEVRIFPFDRAQFF